MSFEVVTAPRTSPEWALIMVALGRHVVAGGPGIIETCSSITNDPEDIGLPLPAFGDQDRGFWLWEGTSHFDGLDDVSYDGTARKVAFAEAWRWFLKAHPTTNADPLGWRL
jgi:hypothetical protein